MIRFSDLPNATTQTDSMDDVHEGAADALRTLFLGLMRLGKLSRLPGGSSQASMGIPRSHVDRLFDLNHASRLNQIETAFRVLGKTLSVDVKDAA